MKIPLFFGMVAIIAITVRADLTAVSVPQTMVHGPNGGAGVGYTGKVEYTLAQTTNDSVFVSLAIIPATGAETPLTLNSVNGDIGLIRVNMNAPSTAVTYAIFFELAAPQPGVLYIARIVANAAVSSMQTDITAKLSSMSKSEKANLCAGGGNGFQSNGAGPIPQIHMSDGPHGVRPPQGGQATCFPTCAGLANTWDTTLARLQGQAMGEEFRSYGFNCQLGPALSLVYHPQGGRASEYYGEDPYQSGWMSAATVIGIQSRGVIATIKHYACNNKEQNRDNGENAVMSERSMREIYLRNWEPSIIDANCWGIMGAYNRVLGIQACESKYLNTDILRVIWGYRGLVMTDWGAAMNQGNAAQYGVDIKMPTGSDYAGVVGGQSDAIVNMHASRIIYAHEKIGDLKAGYNRTAYTRNTTVHADVALQVGTAGIVLAKNIGNILPLPKTGKKIAIKGPFANSYRAGPGGSSYVTAWRSSSPQAGINSLLSSVGAGASTITTDQNAADYIIVFIGVDGESEGNDRPSLGVSGDNYSASALAATNGQNKTVVVFTGGSAASAGNWSKANAVVIAFYPGQEQGAAIADVLFGNANPCGKLAVTFPVDGTQLPPFTLSNNNLNYPSSDVAHGYFRVNKNNQTPLFAFGHGLSYTTFTYSNLQIFPGNPAQSQPPIQAGDRVIVRVTVANTGTIAGKEVVQLYLSMPDDAGLPVRVQDLRGFQKVALNAGANTTVTFNLTQEEMKVYDPGTTDFDATGGWKVLPGTYTVRVGTSSQRDLQPSLSGSFVVK
jgi:beta-glucosidase